MLTDVKQSVVMGMRSAGQQPRVWDVVAAIRNSEKNRAHGPIDDYINDRLR